jgi:hypothetical protein
MMSSISRLNITTSITRKKFSNKLALGPDPDASLQTGPGLPQWQWTRIPLSWNGSVDSQQQIRFWYLGPKASLLLNFLRVILVVILRKGTLMISSASQQPER